VCAETKVTPLKTGYHSRTIYWITAIKALSWDANVKRKLV